MAHYLFPHLFFLALNHQYMFFSFEFFNYANALCRVFQDVPSDIIIAVDGNTFLLHKVTLRISHLLFYIDNC